MPGVLTDRFDGSFCIVHPSVLSRYEILPKPAVLCFQMSFLSESEDGSNPTITTLKILIIGESGVGKSR